MCPSVATDLHTGESAKTDYIGTLGHIILPPKQPVFALSPVCRSVVTPRHIIIHPRQSVFALSPV
jgi:hypothetical protein